jgi:hypothetical protein
VDTRHILITKYDVQVMRLLSASFNEAIKTSPNFEAAIEGMVFSQRESIPELKQEDFYTLLKGYNLVFLSKDALRERVIDLNHHILSEDVHPGLGANDCIILRVLIGKQILATTDWAV